MSCGNCKIMPTITECLCCCEIEVVAMKKENLSCILMLLQIALDIMMKSFIIKIYAPILRCNHNISGYIVAIDSCYFDGIYFYYIW